MYGVFVEADFGRKKCQCWTWEIRLGRTRVAGLEGRDEKLGEMFDHKN